MEKSSMWARLGAILPLAVITAYFQRILIPFIVLIVVMILDYLTGMTKAFVTKKLCSKTGFIGIVKKLCYFVVILVGMGCDVLIAEGFGGENINIISLLIIIWLALNEMISILENLAQIGIPIPVFLLKVIEKLKVKTEEGQK